MGRLNGSAAKLSRPASTKGIKLRIARFPARAVIEERGYASLHCKPVLLPSRETAGGASILREREIIADKQCARGRV